MLGLSHLPISISVLLLRSIYISFLKTEEENLSEMSVNMYQATRRHVSDKSICRRRDT
jgi:hypothetical protein